MPIKFIKCVVLRPFYHKGTQYKSGDTARLTEREFNTLSNRSHPIVAHTATKIADKYETKTPASAPKVEHTGAGWYTVKLSDGSEKRIRGEEALNEFLESNA